MVGFIYIYIYIYIYLFIKAFYSPTDAQLNCLKSNFKSYIKIAIKTAPTCFGAVTCRSCFNVNFHVTFKIAFKTVHLCIGW